jgi:hypothetical protein
MDEITSLVELQAGVLSRRQVLANGLTQADIERRLRRREWVSLMPGVFLDHTGSPSRLQGAWAGVLHHEPAALGGQSALRAAVGPTWRHHKEDGPITIAIGLHRTLKPVPGYHLVPTTALPARVACNTSPPRLSMEHAVLDLASDLDEYAAIGLLADLCQTRRTTALRIVAALEFRGRIRGRAWLASVLTDVAEGTCSVLEHGYLTRVERPHGLPPAERQTGVPVGRRPVHRDVVYRQHGLDVELDGRLFHDSAGQRDIDLERDLAAALVDRRTVRLGWGQVFDRGCQTAVRLARLLRLGGWEGELRPCGPGCVAA